MSTFIGVGTAYAGGLVSNFVSPYVSGVVSQITSSPVLQGALTNGVSYAASGFAVGTGVSILQGNNMKTALRDGGQGALFGLGMGVLNGSISGYKYAKANNLDPWSGKTVYPPFDGFVNGTQYKTQAKPGEQFTHYGDVGNSKYLTTPGTTPEQVSLPPNNNLTITNFQVNYPFNLTGGIAAPWFNQSGGGSQFTTTVPLWWLRNYGYISKIP